MIFAWYFFVEKVSQLSKNVLMMVMGFASKFTLVLFKLIAVIDCASKMMMMLCSCGWRVIPCFLLQIFFNITLFVTFLLRTIEEFFLLFLFSYQIFSHYSQILNKKLILFYFRVWFCCVVFQSCVKLSKTYSTNHFCSLCMSKCRLVYW